MFHQLDGKTLVSGQIRPDHIDEIKALGVTTVVNNRPDGEDPEQPLASDIQTAAEEAGMIYVHLPIVRGIGPADIEALQEAIDASEGKLLAFCRSGTRSTLAWALARRETGASREEIEQGAAAAGVSLAPIAHLL